MKNSQEGFVVPLLITIIALLIIGGGVYTYKSNNIATVSTNSTEVQKSNQVQIPDQQKIQNSQSTSQPGPTSAWKTYSNTKYGFEVQYPPNGFLTGDNYRFSADINDYVIEIRIPSPQAFLIEVTSQKDLESFSKSSISLAKQNGGTVKNITVGGVPAVEIFTKSMEGDEYRSVLFVKNGNGYYINLLGPGFENSEKMLTTFKFTK